jgi:hypothetical protein
MLRERSQNRSALPRRDRALGDDEHGRVAAAHDFLSLAGQNAIENRTQMIFRLLQRPSSHSSYIIAPREPLRKRELDPKKRRNPTSCPLTHCPPHPRETGRTPSYIVRLSMGLPFSIVIPTYNEAGGIERLLRALGNLFAENGLDGEIVVVDDNSPDGTGAIVDRLASELPVRCLHRPGKLGLSSGVIDGWKFARQSSQALGAMDADFSHDIAILPQMVKALESGEYGLAIGSRYVQGGGIENWPKRRIITSRVACTLARPLTNVKDITSGYFLVKREALNGVELDPIGFKIGLEVVAKAHYGRAIEIPYVFKDRTVGESKLNQSEIFNYLKQLRKLYVARLFPSPAKSRGSLNADA